MEVVIVDTPESGGSLVAEAIVRLVARRPDATVGFATGSSPEPVYAALARRCIEEGVDLSRLRGFLLDEYVGLAPGDPRSYQAEIQRKVFERLGLPSDNLRAPDASAADLEAACASYEAAIAAAGGIDLQLLGVGSDGHIGFNEPTSSLGSRTRIKSLRQQTREDNARFFDDNVDVVPRHVLTQGIGTIRDARHLILVAWGSNKAEAVASCVEGPVTSMVPASALHLHPHATVVIDDAAARSLTLSDYFRRTWAAKPDWQYL